MAQVPMRRGVARSPPTTLVSAIDADDLEIVVASTANLPPLPNRLVLCESEDDPDGETVSVASADGTTLTLSARGANATSWPEGTIVWRPVCFEDLDEVQDNVEDHETRIAALEAGWTPVIAYTATPPSTSTLTMTADLTGVIAPGTPIKFIGDGDPYYAICTAITSNLLTIAGAPIEGAIDALYYGDPSRVFTEHVLIPGYYEDASTTRTTLADDLGAAYSWPRGTAYLVRVQAKTKVADSSSNGTVNVGINGADVLSTALTLANANWTASVVQIATANYDIQFGEALEISVGKGTGGDAQDLSLILTFVPA